ncbi:MAG: glycosyltransferase family 39 protein [Planctomycetes bacterium]|nr:glycosyltransferase family 39 protein [Planctomycetota bacterium]
MRFIAYLLLALVALTTLPGLGERDFWPPDEARYGAIAAEMEAEGVVAALRLNGEAYGDKPPGYFWLVRAAAWFRGGVDEWCLRLPSVLGAAILVLALGLAVGRSTGAQAGFLAGILPLATAAFAWQARYAQLDLLFAGLLTWSAFDGFRALEEGRAGLLTRSGLALGLAVLVKGPLALLVLPLLVLWRLIGRPPRREGARPGPGIYGFLVALILPIALWLILAVEEAGFAFVRDELFMRNVVDRAAKGLAHLQPWHFYLRRLPAALAPFILVLPLWLLPSIRALVGAPGRRLAAFCLLWILLFLLVQSLFPGKRSIYAFLFHAPFQVLFAQAIAAGVSERADRLARGWLGLVLGLIGLVLLGIGAGFLLWSFPGALRDRVLESLPGASTRLAALGLPAAGEVGFAALARGARLAALPFLAGAVLVAVDLLRRRLDFAIDKAALALALGLCACCALLVPALDGARSRRGLAEELRARVGDRPMAIYRHHDEGILYYFGRRIAELRGDEAGVPADLDREARVAALERAARVALEGWLATPANEFLLIRADDRAGLPPAIARRRWQVVHDDEVGRDHGFELLRFAAVEEEERR